MRCRTVSRRVHAPTDGEYHRGRLLSHVVDAESILFDYIRYDKLQIIVCADGEAGINFEHTSIDGHTVLR